MTGDPLRDQWAAVAVRCGTGWSHEDGSGFTVGAVVVAGVLPA